MNAHPLLSVGVLKAVNYWLTQEELSKDLVSLFGITLRVFFLV